MTEVIRKTKDIKGHIAHLKAGGKTIGFVPTMGALHEGHLSLIRRARAENDAVVLSIFVNPTQFDRRDDFLKYPRQLESDLEVASREGVDVVFAPSAEDMYPTGFSTYVEVGGSLTNVLCGATRPGHFRGVATVVTKLFNIVRPNRAYFGQKDLQQAAVIKRLVRDLEMGIEIVVLPTVRDAGGLAVSSRNQLLSNEERESALSIYRALKRAAELYASGEKNTRSIIKEMHRILNEGGIYRIDYISIVDPETLEELEVIEPHSNPSAAVAAWVGSTRLIDNLALGVRVEQELFLSRI